MIIISTFFISKSAQSVLFLTVLTATLTLIEPNFNGVCLSLLSYPQLSYHYRPYSLDLTRLMVVG